MTNINKLLIFLTISVLAISANIALAQEDTTVLDATQTASQEVIITEENIQPQDLDVSNPTILPDSPFYFLKNLSRNIQSIFTFNAVAKSELKQKFSNEKLVELQTLIDQKKDNKVIEKATESYKKEIKSLKESVDNIKDKAATSPELKKFLDKFIQKQILQQKILQKLEAQVPAEVFEKIKSARENSLERFGEVMTKLETKTETIQKNVEAVQGGEFKDFKNLEILKELELKSPEAIKETVRNAGAGSLMRIREKLEGMSSTTQEKFKEYLSETPGNKEKQLEILEDLKSEMKAVPEMLEKIETGKVRIIKKIEEKLEKDNCAAWTFPTPDFCKNGRVVISKDENGCPLPAKCIAVGENTTSNTQDKACVTLWSPVCGKDGKTYSNKCFIQATNIEIDYFGACK